MIKKIKTLVFIFIILFSVPTFVEALQHEVSIGGNNNVGSACSPSGSYPWCFNRHGIRISLYKYKSGTLNNYGSVDFETNYSYTRVPVRENLTGLTAHIAISSSGNLAGKVAYNHFGYSVNWSSGYYKLALKDNLNGIIYKDLDCVANWYGCKNVTATGGLKDDILAGFSLNSGNPNTVVTKINNVFSSVSGVTITVADLQYLYITVEPTLYIYHGGESYYGTLYELGTGSYPGVNQEIFYRFPTGIYAAKPTNTDTNNFVGRNGDMVKVLTNYASLITESGLDSGTNLPANKLHVLTKEGYGIGVFWIGDYVPATCLATCGENNLKCAENYCDSKSDSIQKRTCMVDECKVVEPGYLSCSESCSGTSNTNCDNNPTLNSISTKCTKERYRTTKCVQEIKNFKYSNDLPDIFDAGVGGFNYSAHMNVSKECTITFNTYAYEFDYASVKSTERETSSTIIAANNAFNQFKAISGDSDNSEYKYKSSGDSMNLKVDSESYPMDVERNLPIAEYKGTTSNSTIHKYENGHTTSEIFENGKIYVSNGEITYTLRKQCYSIKTASIYKLPTSASTCPNDDLLSYGYYNVKKTGKTDVYINANLNNGCLNNNHTCYYMIADESKDPTCYINVTKQNPTSYELRFYVENPAGKLVMYSFDTISNQPTTDPLTITSPITKNISVDTYVNGKIQYIENGDTVTKYCPAELKISNTLGPNCATTFGDKYAKYEKIQSFCAEHWSEDVNNYVSEKDCVDKCGKPKEEGKTCKKFVCSNYSSIEQWCNIESNYEGAGYKSKEQCINDCSCKTPEVKEYIYRPIALGGDLTGSNPIYNAFPNGRKSGSNWTGYEAKYTTKDIFKKENGEYTNLPEPIYVIELNKNSIKIIKENTKTSNKTVYLYNESDTVKRNGFYCSKFIKDNSDIFTVRNRLNVGGGC